VFSAKCQLSYNFVYTKILGLKLLLDSQQIGKPDAKHNITIIHNTRPFCSLVCPRNKGKDKAKGFILYLLFG